MMRATYLDPVNGMNVLHAINHDPSYFLEILVFAHGRDGVSLDKDVAVRQEFDSLRREVLVSNYRESYLPILTLRVLPFGPTIL